MLHLGYTLMNGPELSRMASCNKPAARVTKNKNTEKFVRPDVRARIFPLSLGVAEKLALAGVRRSFHPPQPCLT